MKKRLISALCALSMTLSLMGCASANPYSVTLSKQEASQDIPTMLNLPPQTPSPVQGELQPITVTAPIPDAAIGIPMADGAEADVVKVLDDGTWQAMETEALFVDGVLYTMLTNNSATMLLLEQKPFKDVSPSSWFYGAVSYVYHYGLMSGSSETSFSPNTAADRAGIVTILWRLAGKPAPKGSASFSDVPRGKYYTDPVLWAAENGIVTGSNGKFNPGKSVTRAELAVFLYRFAKYQGQNVSGQASLASFQDAKKVPSWAKDALAWAVDTGLISGKGSKEILAPAGTASRAELATILMRFLEK